MVQSLYLRHALASLAIVVTLAAPASALEEVKFVPNDLGIDDRFGCAVALAGNVAIVGTFEHDGAYADSGAAYVVDVTTGSLIHKLTASDARQYAGLGFEISAWGNQALIGAPWDSEYGNSAGAAYLFNTQTGQQIAKLVSSDLTAGDRMGMGLGLNSRYAVVGSRADMIGGVQSAGSAYVFDAETGVELCKLLPDSPVRNAFFGTAVSVGGDLALIGAPWDDGAAADTGAAYLFDLATGNQVRKLTAEDGFSGATFGTAVALGDGIAVVGAHAGGDPNASGSAYVYDLDTGNLLATLAGPDGTANDGFGESLAISGNLLIVGQSRGNGGVDGSGAAYVFDLDTFQLVRKLTATDAERDDRYGVAVGLDGDRAVVGAMWDDDATRDAGAAYLYAGVPEPTSLLLLTLGGLGMLRRR